MDKPKSTQPFDITGQIALDASAYAEQKAAELVVGINKTTKQRFADAVATGIEDQLGVDGISQLLRTIAKDMSTTRAETIASTEVNSAMSHATVEKLKTVGVEYKQWIIADDDADDICKGNEEDGPIPTGEAFSSGDFYPPAHPNCRCAVTGVRSPFDEAYDPGESRDEGGRWTASGASPISKKEIEKLASGKDEGTKKQLFHNKNDLSFENFIRPKEDSGKPVVKSLAVKDLVPRQEVNYPVTVKKYIDDPTRFPQRKVQVTKVNDKFLILNGHHRVAAAIATGQTHIDAQIFPRSIDYKKILRSKSPLKGKLL